MKIKKSNKNLFTWIILCLLANASLLSSCKKDTNRADAKNSEQEAVRMHKFTIDGMEVVVEEKNGEFHYDHDILLSGAQMNELRKWNGTTATDDRGAVLVKGAFTTLWPNQTLIYDANFVDAIGDSVKLADLKRTVPLAMRIITEKTGFKFKERTNETNYVQFISHPTDNNSMVGMVGGVQKINIAYRNSIGTSLHEILHAVGVFHEQSRADRDEYIFTSITTGAAWGIKGQMIGAFNPSSVMLYTVNFKPDSLYQYSPQFTDTLSKGDILTMNFLYPKAIESGKKYKMYSKKNAQWVLQGTADGLVSVSKDNPAINGQGWILESVDNGNNYIIRSAIDDNLVLVAPDSTSLKLLPFNFDKNKASAQQFVVARSSDNRHCTLTSKKYPSRIVSASSRGDEKGKQGRDVIHVKLDKRTDNEFQEFVLVEDKF